MGKDRNILCPSCQGDQVISIGEVPLIINEFAGNIFYDKFPKRELLKCRNCYLFFNYPRPDKEELCVLYQCANPNNWQYELKDRKDWGYTIKWIKKLKKEALKILDVGCWDGKFLEKVENCKRYGIEINPIASEKAKGKGIEIIAKDIYEIENLSFPYQFDVITAFDVIEHIDNPFKFISLLTKITEPNGFIVISSGNTNTISWKISRSKYYYCALPEHISFINKNWCEFVAKRLNLKIIYFEKFSHTSSNLKKILFETMKNLIYLISPSIFLMLRKIKQYLSKYQLSKNNYPPWWGTVKNHILIIFEKV